MAEAYDPAQNPFSAEKAWVTFQDHMEGARKLLEEIRKEQAEGTATDREMLLQAVDALGKLTDNTILYRVVRKGLEARDAG